MRNFLWRQLCPFRLLSLVILLSSVSCVTDAEYTTTIKTTLQTHLDPLIAENKGMVTFECKAESTEPEKIKGCSICIKGVSAANLDHTIEFITPQETSKLVASNVDIKDPDEDFDIKHYVAAFVKSCKLVLSDAQLLESIKKTLEATATELTLQFNQDNAATKEYLLLIGEGADKRSNNAISVKIDLEKLSVTFKTNFFENTFSLSMRHSLFVEAEVKRAVTQMHSDLVRMKKLLANDAETKSTVMTMTCATFLASEYVTAGIAKRLEKVQWTVAAEESQFTITAGEKTFPFVCSESLLDGKIGILKWVMSYADKKTMSQAFLKTSMYDEAAIVEMYLDDLITFLIRFASPTNPDEAVDFGKTPLVAGTGGGEGGEGGAVVEEAPVEETPTERLLKIDDGESKVVKGRGNGRK